MPNYFPVTIDSIRSDTIIGCDLYLLMHVDDTNRFVLYCRGNSVFESKKRDLLLKKNVNRLFISRNDKNTFFRYLESNFPQIFTSTNITSEEKSKIIYNTATNLIHDLFENPVTGNIERSKKFAYNLVDYIIQDKEASHGLLKIAEHEYYTYAHSVNVAAKGILFASTLGFSESDLKSICLGMFLHDIGKTKIKSEILDKKGELTEDEYEIIKLHPELGVAIIKETESSFNDNFMIILQHHENCDGSGYPHGLRKEEIHTCARIVRIIDVYDALTSKRSYAGPQKPFEALTTIRGEMSDIVDMVLFKRFIKFLGR